MLFTLNTFKNKYESSFSKFHSDEKNKSKLYEELYKCSPKMINIIFNILKSKGPVLVYSNYVEMEGLQILKIYMQFFGFIGYNDDAEIDKEMAGLKKIDPKGSFEISTRLKHMITSINGDYDKKTVREFVDYALLARDAKAFRDYISTINPGIDMTYTHITENGVEEDIVIPVGLNFFWPNA